MSPQVSHVVAAALIGRHVTTLRRWLGRRQRGEPLGHRRGPRPLLAPESVRSQASSLVRELRGLVGTESLRRTCPGLTRSEAGKVKLETCQAIERERRAAAHRVVITAPGVVRGFDSMQLRRDAHFLIAADSAVPFRTSWSVATRYDGPAVAALFRDDFARHGAPLVMRLDRAKQHDVPAVQAVLRDQGVLTLHGPPHRPQYYGQLERLNVEHRAWLAGGGVTTNGALEDMVQALNESWRRRRLGWRTATEAWQMRPHLDVNRTELRAEVEDRWTRLASGHGVSHDLAWRLAIEQVLTARGLLRVVNGGWC